MSSFICGIFHADSITDWKTVAWIKDFAIFMDNILLPIILSIAGVGIVWVVILGIRLARTRDDTLLVSRRKGLVKVAVGIALLMAFLFLITFLSVKLPSMIQD